MNAYFTVSIVAALSFNAIGGLGESQAPSMEPSGNIPSVAPSTLAPSQEATESPTSNSEETGLDPLFDSSGNLTSFLTSYPTTSSPSNVPSMAPSHVPSFEPTTFPSDFPSSNPTEIEIPNSTVDTWVLVSTGSDPRVHVGQDPLVVLVEMDFFLSSAEMAVFAEVSIYPYDECGTGLPVLEGMGFLCSETEEGCVEPGSSSQDVIYTAVYGIGNLEEQSSSSLWDPENKRTKFCGRLSVTRDDILVSFSDMNFDFVIDYSADFAIVDMELATPSGTITFSQSFAWAVLVCVCNSANICYSSALPPFGVGSEVRICIKVPEGEGVEILLIETWELTQEGVGGVSRLAISDGVNDGLTSSEFLTPQEVVATTSLNAAFLENPDAAVILQGTVLVKPEEALHHRHVRRLMSHNNIFSKTGGEPAPFRIELSLVGGEAFVGAPPADGIIVFISLLLLLATALVVMSQQGSGRNQQQTSNSVQDSPFDSTFLLDCRIGSTSC